ncbi:MAG: SO2930 family diheme c-type cytochrome [Bacteroidota bacterium]
MKKLATLFSLLICIVFFTQCQQKEQGIVIPEKPYETLSEYQFFQGDLAALKPSEGVLPYDLNSPLFTDYAHKARFVWMPTGTSANYTGEGVLDFPLNAVLIKNFYYKNDERKPEAGRNIIETRILINRGEEWEAIGYLWNKEQTEAYHEVVGDIQEVSWMDKMGEEQTIEYVVPNKNQCKNCHLTGKKQIPIGPKVRNLNKSYAYADGTMNQLDKWASVGYLSGYDADAEHPAVAVWDNETSGTLHERALSYLDINCAHCHKEDGSANTSGLHLDADAELDMSLGIYKATVSAGAGTGGHTYSIVPGHPEESILVYRMSSTNPGVMMPELGRGSVHKEGVALISEWIKNMEQDEKVEKLARLQ